MGQEGPESPNDRYKTPEMSPRRVQKPPRCPQKPCRKGPPTKAQRIIKKCPIPKRKRSLLAYSPLGPSERRRRPKRAPQLPKKPPRGLQDGPRRAQSVFLVVSFCLLFFLVRSVAPLALPRSKAQDGPGGPRKRPKMAPGRAQEAPEKAPRRQKKCRRRPKKPPAGPQNPPRGLKKGPKTLPTGPEEAP
eukprot:3410048-Pyramimonas_sp.AAC.1